MKAVLSLFAWLLWCTGAFAQSGGEAASGPAWRTADPPKAALPESQRPTGAGTAPLLTVGRDYRIGPNDLLSMMHLPPAMESPAPQFVEALAHIVATADKYGVAPGIHTASAEACRRRMDEGFRFMAIASDARFMVAGAQAQLGDFKKSGGKEVLRY